MSNMATYARIFKLEPDDDYVGKRQRAVSSIRVAFASMTPASKSLDLASSIAEALQTGTVPPNLAAIAGTALANESDSFVAQGEQLQMLVCAMVAALESIGQDKTGDGWTPIDALAAGLWSALSFQEPDTQPEVEQLRANLIEASRNRVAAVSHSSRNRVEVPDIGKLSIPEAAPAGARASTAFRDATRPLVAALRKNAEADREEINLLWWVLADYSDILDRPMAELESSSRAVAAGIDCLAMMYKLPSIGHRNLILRNVKKGESLTLMEVLKQLGDDREKLGNAVAGELIKSAPAVFPLLTALATGNSEKPGANVPYEPRDWGARALLEASILAVSKQGLQQ